MTNILAYYSISASIKRFNSKLKPGACAVKLFTTVMNYLLKYVSVFVALSWFNPSLIFANKSELPYVTPLWDSSLPTKIRLHCKCLAVANTLAYYSTKILTSIKCFNSKLKSWAYAVKLFICQCKLVFVIFSQFYPSLIFANKFELPYVTPI